MKGFSWMMMMETWLSFKTVPCWRSSVVAVTAAVHVVVLDLLASHWWTATTSKWITLDLSNRPTIRQDRQGLLRTSLRGKDWAIRWQQQTAIEADCCTDLGFPETDCPNTSSKTKRNRWMTTESLWNTWGIWVGGRGGKLLDSAAGKTCPSPSIDLRLVGDSASLLSSYDCCW